MTTKEFETKYSPDENLEGQIFAVRYEVICANLFGGPSAGVVDVATQFAYSHRQAGERVRDTFSAQSTTIELLGVYTKEEFLG